ncbi:protoporphyrinogen/coproporphyrinogen oxidase [Anaeromyxobacter paludicola]|uniref:FAD-dependent oxidoreductase n=1 Tax=Anaeromyxobacter paludicola TaxID=2918171 RepID=A0ABM7XB47_9BACT|nr:FAD-dependent oxidoreductase [Anaeromyxobacter paludicola]BDG09072.1 FAD-dependent oxidoreductase [Anaeromyxobacter paludicola]
MERYDAVVVGGGVSGAAFAWQCARAGKKVLLLEREPRLGGCLHSQRTSAGYWYELGAHTCYNSYAGFIELLEGAGLKGRLLPRAKVPFALLKDGQLHPLTPGGVLKLLDLWELARSLPAAFTAKKDGQTMYGYYSRLFGRRNYDRVMGPLFSAVPSQSADPIPADMLFKKRSRRKDVLRSFTLDGGLQTVVDAAARTAGVEVATGAPARTVEKTPAGWAVVTEDGRRFEAPVLALATPPSAAAALLQAAQPELAGKLASIKMSGIETVGVVVEAARLKVPPVAGIVPIDDAFFSAVSRDTVPDPRLRGFAFHFRPQGLPLEQKLERIARVLGVARADLSEVVEKRGLMPSPVLGHEQVVADIDRLLAGGTLAITGNYFGGLAIEDCVQRSKEEFGRVGKA